MLGPFLEVQKCQGPLCSRNFFFIVMLLKRVPYVILNINLCTYRLSYNHTTHAYLRKKCRQYCKTNTMQINIVNGVRHVPLFSWNQIVRGNVKMVVKPVVQILLRLDSLYYYVLMIPFFNHFSSDLPLMSFGFRLVQSHHL